MTHQATARAHSNIALVKYWGKRDRGLNLPAADSLSMTLEALSTTTTVRFDASLQADEVHLDGHRLAPDSRPWKRVSSFVERIRQATGRRDFAHVESHNDFPTAAGLASSASGFAALALAATRAAGLHWDRPHLSRLARMGSGSAARSIYGGFVHMHAGEASDGTDAYAHPLFEGDHWPLTCIVALTTSGPKDISSTAGMLQTQQTSPLFEPWRATVTDDIDAATRAIDARDLAALTAVAERSCLRMHATALGADPAVLYWQPATVALIHAIRQARDEGLRCFLTIDAGPHVKVFCPPEATAEVEDFLRAQPGVRDLITSAPGPGAHLIDEAP